MRRELDLDQALELAERPGVVHNDRSLIRDMAERMAAERIDRRRRLGAAMAVATGAVVRQPPVPAMPAGALDPAKLPRLKSVQVLYALNKAVPGRGFDVAGIQRLLPHLSKASIASYLTPFVGKQWAVRFGTARYYTYTIGPKGLSYLKTFHPPD